MKTLMLGIGMFAAPVIVLIMGHMIANFGGQKAFGVGYYRSFAPAFLLAGVCFLLTGAVMLRLFR